MFKDDLCAAMKKEKVSIAWLAEYLGVSKKAVSNWRSGFNLPKPYTMNEICKLFNLPKDSYKEEDIVKKEYGKTKEYTFAGGRLKDHMKASGRSAKTIASFVGVAESTVHNWMAGIAYPNGIEKIRKLNALFGIKDDDYWKIYKKSNKGTVQKDEKQQIDISYEYNFADIDRRFDAIDEIITRCCKKLDETVEKLAVLDASIDLRFDKTNKDILSVREKLANTKTDKSESISDGVTEALKALSSIVNLALEGAKL